MVPSEFVSPGQDAYKVGYKNQLGEVGMYHTTGPDIYQYFPALQQIGCKIRSQGVSALLESLVVKIGGN